MLAFEAAAEACALAMAGRTTARTSPADAA
jgi:hypothetical protein